jgi:hypothetical protein
VLSAELGFNGRLQFWGLEAAGAGGGFVPDAAVFAYEIEPVGPGGVIALDSVIESVDDGGELDAEITDAGGGVFVLLLFGLGVFKEDVVAEIGGGLAAVGSVGFADVDEEEGDFLLVGGGHFVEVPDLGTEGGSSVGAEDESDGLLALEVRETDLFFGLGLAEVEIRGGVAGLQAADSLGGVARGLVLLGEQGGGREREKSGPARHS